MKLKLIASVFIFFYITSLRSQQLTNYAFTNPLKTFVPLVAGTQPPLTAGDLDDGYVNAIPIGFAFYYMGQSYTTLSASTNGFVVLGQNLTGSFPGNDLDNSGSITPRPILAPLWDNLRMRSANNFSYETSGITPNRVFTMEWLHVIWTTTATDSAISTQLKLYEADGKIEFCYAQVVGTSENASTSIGISGTSAAQYNRTVPFLSINETPAVAATEFATFDSKTVTNGRAFTFFIGAAPAAPITLTFPTVASGYTNLQWIDNSTTETYFIISRRTGANPFAEIGRVASTTKAATGGAYTFVSQNLSASTLYDYQITAANEANAPSATLAASQATNAGTAISGTKTICAACDYPTLGAAFSEIQTGSLSGPVILELATTYNTLFETYPLVVPNATAVNTITVRPAAAVTDTIRFINTGANALFSFDNASHILLDGRNGGAGTNRLLYFANMDTANPVIMLINGASHNTIRNTNITGLVNGTQGLVHFGTSSGSTGNAHNTILNNNFTDTLALYKASNAIYSLGTAGKGNDSNVISGNSIHEFFSPTTSCGGIVVTDNSSAWTITNNVIYQSATRTFTAASLQYRGIYISNTSGINFSVTNNVIGYSTSLQTGKTTIAGSSNMIRPIYLKVGTAALSRIDGNTIAGFSQSSSQSSSTDGNNSFIGIRVDSGLVHVGSILKNTIGSMTTPSLTLTDASIYVATATNAPVVAISITGVSNDSIAHNEIGGVYANSSSLGFQGIRHAGSGSVVIYQNTIGGNILNSVVGNITANTPAVIGIVTTSGINTVVGNTVQNITNTGASTRTSSATGTIGISQTSATAGQTVTRNLVYNIANTNTGTGAYGVIGIYYSGTTSGTNEISRNKIRNLSLNGSGTGAFIFGLMINAGNSTISNNEISIGLNRINDTLTNPYIIRALYEVAGANRYYYNSVLVLGTGVLNNNSTYAFYSNVTTGTRDYRNNVFANMRSFADTFTTRNYAARFAGTISAGALPTATLNYNQYYFPGTGGSLIQHVNTEYTTLAAWKAVFTAHDVNSVVQNPQFNGADNLQSSDPAAITNAVTIAAVTIDINGTTRSNFKPGAYDASGDVKPPTFIHTVSTRRSSTTSDTIFATISDVSGVRSVGTLRPTAYYKKNSGTRHAALGTLVSGNGLSATWEFILDAATMGSLVVGDTIKYYIIAQDSVVPTANIGSSPTGAVATSVDAIVSDPSVFNQVRIVDPLNNLFYIGESGECAHCDYESLTAIGGFFADVNGGLLGSNTTVIIETNLANETGALSLNQAGIGSFSLTIKPTDTASVVKVISNASILTTPLIKINAGNISIDGRVNGSGHFLRFVNTHTTIASAQSTFLFDETASHDTIQNCIIENNTATAARGCIAFGSNGTLSNIVIKRNIIRGAEGSPGTAGYTHSGIVGLGVNTNSFIIGGSTASDSNDFYNFRSAGVSFTSSGNNHTIRHNNFYFTTGTSTSTSNFAVLGINVVNGYGHHIANNSIGGSNKSRTGAAMTPAASVNQPITGILLNASAIDSSIVENNTISNIGHLTNNTAKNTLGINISAGKVRVSNNTVGGGALASDTLRSGAIGACINVSGGDVLIKNNIVGNLTYSGGGTGLFANAGIRSSGGNVSVIGNTIKNITAFSGQTTTGAEYPAGIILAGTTSLATEISGNIIHDILATRDTISALLPSRVYGIRSDNATGTQSIYKNTIYNINTVEVTGGGNMQIVGISARGTSSPQTIHNNMISLVQTIGEPEIRGIETASTGTKNVFYNSVYVGGNVASGATKCYAYYKEATTGIHAVRNNLFYTDRSGGTGNFLTVGIATTTTLTFSNNTLISTDSTKVGDVAGTVYNFSSFNSNATHSVGRYGLASLYPSASFFTAKASANLANNSCVTNDGGTPVAITIDFNNTTRGSINPDIGATEFSGAGISWLGANTDYNNPINWCGYAVPPTTIAITIPVTANDPVLSANTSIGDVNIASGVKVSIGGRILTLTGSLSGAGQFSGSSTSSIVVSGTGNIGTINMDQTIPGTTNTLSSFTINRGTNPATGSATLGNTISLHDSLVLTRGTLNTGGHLTLLSSASNTASLVQVIPANAALSGNITVQRFITNLNNRNWRFLGSPVSGTTLADWKNEIHITGAGGNANGFDSTLSNQASCYWYDETLGGSVNAGWTSPTNTANSMPVGRGYRIFIRGPRSAGNGLLDGSISTQSAVTLDLTGSANIGDIIMPVSYTNTGVPANDGWCLLSNPYASQISWNSFYDDASARTNINPTVYVLDAVTTNGYVSYNANSDLGTLANGIIPSGGALFCQTTGVSPAFTFKETHKSNGTPQNLQKKTIEPFSITFYANNAESDKFLFKPMQEATPLFDMYDIKKLYNANIDISSFGLDSSRLSGDCRPLVADTEVVHLSIRSSKPGNMFFDIDGLDAIDPNYSVWLIDNYTQTKKQITAAITIPFTIDNNDQSSGDNRFVLVFGKTPASPTGLAKTPATKASVYYYPNPIGDILNIAYYNNASENLVVTLSDYLGKSIQTSTHEANKEGVISSNVASLASGVYILTVTNKYGLVISTTKIVK